jgi:monovalent cation:H+ antiporter-2, CPA2 family
MHLQPLIQDLAVILCVAGLVAFLFQRIRQPLVLGYIVAGVIVGPHTLHTPLVSDLPSVRVWAELGVIFLMFSLGLEFSFRRLSHVGASAVATATLEMSLMWVLGFFWGRWSGWSLIDSVFVGAMVSVSSTTIIAKALDELKLKTKRFSTMIFAILVVEDLFAVLILVVLSTIALSGALSGMVVLSAALRLALVIGGWFISGYLLVPRLVRFVGRYSNNEMLTVISVALCLFLSVFAAYFGYSIALGAFIMGSILAESTESYRIEERIEPLRDLFAAIFFVSVGMLMDPKILLTHWGAVISLAALVMVGKITGVTLGALITGQTLRTSIQVGFGLTQIGEFSFIIAALGLTLGVTSEFLYPVAVAVSLITTLTTPYFIRISHKFAVGLEARLPLEVKSGLNRYAVWVQTRRGEKTRRKIFYHLLFRWALNGLVVSVIFVVSSELMLPLLLERVSERAWMPALGWLLTASLSLPFIWAMLSVFKRYHDEQVQGVLLFFRIFSVIWIGILSANFFPVRYAALFTIAVVLLILALFYRQVEELYHWFECQFLSTFEVREKTRPPLDIIRKLAPWDAHLVRLKVHPNSEFVAKPLSETQLRSKYGLNVVAIQRGLTTLVAPKPQEMVLPKDELLVLATDEEIETVRPILEKPPGLEHRFHHIAGYELRQIRVTKNSVFADKSIRESGIRESFNAMVVGIESEGRRIINPDSDLRITIGDTLWIVGEMETLDRLESLLPAT